jgi:hypothetical protein
MRRIGGIDELAVHDEQGVEQSLLGNLCRLDVVVNVDAGILRDARVLPEAVLAGAADTVDGHGEMKLAGHCVSFLAAAVSALDNTTLFIGLLHF